jgi:hypothetical protein
MNDGGARVLPSCLRMPLTRLCVCVRLLTALLEAMRVPGSSRDGTSGDDSAVFERVAVVSDYSGVRRFVTAWRTHTR